ncbi:RagB/SusD family nutrient uptake outer membrane protein [Chitinophaga sp. S165]|uniref:RagB/SusD family nutrient uptake outer membrane protein n=1 Tax=Chitinophaga sp. S165 TaxID=2135462 RepID=UPI000D71559B|nr:RagB/SusD family nutrient uptake outer membrane protein [Chitinophaga sp. S165]PWV49577.1 putative outer membrane starch-binding protein [Chitinophaga sp. S165]
MKRFLLPVLLCCLFACKKDQQPDPVDTPPVEEPVKDTTTRITVWDATLWSKSNPKGLPVEGATVELYATQQDYVIKKPALTATTDKNGIASFAGKKEGEYFIVAYKDKKTNIWKDKLGRTKISDTLFQSFQSTIDPDRPKQINAAPGDFMFRDLNDDFKADSNDVTTAPFFKVTINNNIPVAANTLIGYPVNHEGAPLNTMDEVNAAFAILAQEIGDTHLGFVMLDGVLSDESDGKIVGVEDDIASDWNRIDHFLIFSSNKVIRRLWNEHYASILKINKLLVNVDRITPGYTEVRTQLYGFRALIYLDLLKYFGELPLVKGTFIPEDIYRSSLEVVRDYINQDILKSFYNTWTVTAQNPWYGTVAASFMLRARLYMEASDNTGVFYMTESGWNYYEMFGLSDFSQIFVSPAGSEIIWAISPTLKSPFKEYFVKEGQTVNFFPVIRKTETYLIRALAYFRYGPWGLMKEEGMGIIADRSGRTIGPINTQEDAVRELGKLYTEEFYREGFRYRFLHLTRQAEKVLAPKGYQSYNELMPVPDSILMKYPFISQNPGYK